MSNKSMLRKFLKGAPAKPTPKVPRNKEEINRAYTQLAQTLGDLEVKIEGYKKHREEVFRAIDNLGAEMNERTKIDEKEASKKAEENKLKDAGTSTGMSKSTTGEANAN